MGDAAGPSDAGNTAVHSLNTVGRKPHKAFPTFRQPGSRRSAEGEHRDVVHVQGAWPGHVGNHDFDYQQLAEEVAHTPVGRLCFATPPDPTARRGKPLAAGGLTKGSPIVWATGSSPNPSRRARSVA